MFHRNLALLPLRVLLLPFIVLLQNKHTTLAENVENLKRTHLESAPTLKVQNFNDKTEDKRYDLSWLDRQARKPSLISKGNINKNCLNAQHTNAEPFLIKFREI